MRDLTTEELELFYKVNTKLDDNNIFDREYFQDLYNIHITFTLPDLSKKTITFNKTPGGRLLTTTELSNACQFHTADYFKNWNDAQIQSFFYNQNWAVESYDEEDSDDCLEKKLQALEDDGYEIHTILNNRIIGRIKSNKTLW